MSCMSPADELDDEPGDAPPAREGAEYLAHDIAQRTPGLCMIGLSIGRNHGPGTEIYWDVARVEGYVGDVRQVILRGLDWRSGVSMMERAAEDAPT